MYFIETHYTHHVATTLVLEKDDPNKTYEQFSNYNVITNHAGDVNDRYCKWCKQRKKPTVNVIAL